MLFPGVPGSPLGVHRVPWGQFPEGSESFRMLWNVPRMAVMDWHAESDARRARRAQRAAQRDRIARRGPVA